MRKLHDLKMTLSTDTQLSRLDCMKIKGGTDDKRRDRHGSTSAIAGGGGEIGGVGGSFGG